MLCVPVLLSGHFDTDWKNEMGKGEGWEEEGDNGYRAKGDHERGSRAFYRAQMTGEKYCGMRRGVNIGLQGRLGEKTKANGDGRVDA